MLGQPVIFDASWTAAHWRAEAAEVARRSASDLIEMRCEAPAELSTNRLRRRAAAGGDPSDATPEVVAAMAVTADPWPSAVTIDTSGTPAETLAGAIGRLGRAPTP